MAKYMTNNWTFSLAKSNFKRRFKRNIISIVSLLIGLTSSVLIIGFSYGSKPSILNSTYKQIDYGVATISKEISQSIPGSKMSLVQMVRPTQNELLESEDVLDNFFIEPNLTSLVSRYPIIKSGDDRLEEFSYNPIYSFIDKTINKKLIIKGTIPKEETSYEVLINKKGYEYIQKEFKSEPLGLILTIHDEYEYRHLESDNKTITDYFIFDKEVTIVGVVDDLGFLATPKLYYSYQAIKECIKESLLINLSEYKNEDTNWIDALLECDNNDPLSSYSYLLFIKDYKNNHLLEDYVINIKEPLSIESPSLTVSKALLDLITAATLGMELFLIIALVGTILILGIISFSSYTEDKKTSAILTCLGANKKDIFFIYFIENLLICSISLISTFTISPLLILIGNKLINTFSGFENMIGFPALIFLLLIPCSFLICFLSTYFPLSFSKKISPKEELSEE